MSGACGDNKVERQNTLFSQEERTYIIFQYGKFESIAAVRRAFRKKFYPTNHKPGTSSGRTPYSNEDVQRVQTFFRDQDKAHIKEAAHQLGLSLGSVWKILQKDLKWKAYKPHLVQHLSPANMESRLAACKFWLKFDDSWFDHVVWSDKKCVYKCMEAILNTFSNMIILHFIDVEIV